MSNKMKSLNLSPRQMTRSLYFHK